MSDHERLVAMKHNGFEGIFFMYDGSALLQKRVEDALSLGLKVDMLHLPFKGINSIWLEGHAGDDFVKTLIEGVKFAARYRIRTVVCHLSGGLTPPPPSYLGLGRIKMVHHAAREFGVKLCMENTRDNHYLDYFFDNYSEIDDIGFCFDFGHTNCFTHDTRDPRWHYYVGKLECVHMHDNDGVNDLHAMPLEGNLDWQYLMPMVFRDHPDVPMTLEFIDSTHHDKGMTEERFIAQAAERLTWLESLI